MAVPHEGWRASSRTPNYPPDCVELSTHNPGPTIDVRDSKDPDGPRITVTKTAMRDLLTALRA